MALIYATQYKTTKLSVAGGIDDSQTTGIVLTEVDGIDTAKPGLVALSYSYPIDTSKVEYITYTSINASKELVGVVRGVDGHAAKAHNDQAVVGYVISASHINNIDDFLLVGHSTDASHLPSLPLTTPRITTSINDSGGNEVIKTPATASAVNEITVTNSATGNPVQVSATGGDDNIDLKLIGKGTGTVKKPSSIVIAVLDAATNASVGDGKVYFAIPPELNGMNLIAVFAAVITAGTTNTLDVQLRNVTDSQDMLSTKITIDSTETSTATAATPAVINASYDDVATNDIIAVDIDAVHTTPSKGLILRLTFGF